MYKFLTRICSETGRRENNEDACTAMRIGGNTYLLAIADGIGGKEGGEIASKLVLTSISEYFINFYKKCTSEINLKSSLEEAFLIAQSTIRDYACNSPGLKGMGTTLTILLLDNKRYVWGNIGDSRLYLIQNDGAKLITTDHTHIAAYLKGGGEALPQKVMEQYKNIITRIVDGGNDKPDIYPADAECNLLLEDDIFLLCSDGLIIDKTIDLSQKFSHILKKNIPLAEMSHSLINWALANGSDDNISVVLGAYFETNEIEDYEN